MSETRHDYSGPADVTILGCELKCTCANCPEQYEVYKDNEQIGYLRLRHGYFRADYPTCGGDIVYYTAEPSGDGRFADAGERERYLTDAVRMLLGRHSGNNYKFHVPTIPFDQVRWPPDTPHGAWDVVRSLTEEQCRWALWEALVTCFGAPGSNSPELLADLRPNHHYAWEAQLLLMQIGISKTMPEAIEQFKQDMRTAGFDV